MVERRGLTSNPVPVSIPPAWFLSPPALAATAEEMEASRQKKRRRKKHREQEKAAAASSEAPPPPTTPESKRESTVPVAPETLTSASMAAAGESSRPPANPESESPVPERERKNQVVPPASPLIEEPVRKEEKRRKKMKNNGEATVVIPSPPTAAAAQNLAAEELEASPRPPQTKPRVTISSLPPIAVSPPADTLDVTLTSCWGVEVKPGVPYIHQPSPGHRIRITQEAPPPASPLMQEPLRKEEKRRKKRKNGEAAMVILALPTPAVAQKLQMKSKVTAEGAAVRRKQRRRTVEHEQSGQPPFPIDVHPQGGEEAAAGGGIVGSQCVKRSSSKKSRVLKKQQPLPQGFFPPIADPNFSDQDPNYSSPYGAFFAQFTYKPDHRKDGNGPPLPNTVDPPVRLPPQGHLSSGSSPPTTKETSKAARTTTSNTKQPCPAAASTSGSQEVVGIKQKDKLKNKMTREMAVRESPCPLANPEYRTDSPVPVAPETQTSAEMITVALSRVKEHERKNQEVLPASLLMEESVRKEEKKHKKRKNEESAVMIRSPPTAAVAQILQRESKVTAEGATLRKKHRRRKVEQEQSGQPSFPIDVHPQGGEETTAAGGVMGSHCIKRSSSKKSQVLKKQLQLPQGFFPPIADPNFSDQDPNYSSPYGAFFAQFTYKPDHRKDGNGPPLPNTVDPPVRLPLQGHLSSGSSPLTAKETSKAARTTTSNTKLPCPAAASTSGSQEVVGIKQKDKLKNKMTREMAVRESPCPLANPEYRTDSPVPVAPETQTSAEMITVALSRVKEHERKTQEVLPASLLMEESVRKEEKKHKKRKNEESAVMIRSPPTAAVAQILQRESKVTAEGATLRKKHRRRKVEQEQSGQPSFPIDVHPQVGEETAAAGGVMGSQCIKRSSSKKSRVLKNQQPLPQGFFPPMADPNFSDQDPNYSSPFGAFFAQFAYKPDRHQDGNGPPLPNTADRPAILPPRGHPSSGSSLLTAKEASKAGRAATLNTMQSCPASTSGSQEGVRVKGMEKPEKKMTREKKPRQPQPSLSAAEKRSDKYRRLPLDQLVPPPRSPHNLLQENYASDPWKVIVICMLLNLTQGKQVRNKVEGFFKLYPDPQTAYTADPEKMAEYLAPLGLQHVKTKNIQKFSKAYVEEEWTYITELCGVGKYAADAYAIFCAGRANEVVPKDHKLVDYWNYVCYELPQIQKSKDAQKAGVMGLGNIIAKVQEVAVSC